MANNDIKSAINIKEKRIKFKDQVQEKEINKVFDDKENDINFGKTNLKSFIPNEDLKIVKNFEFPTEKTFDGINKASQKNFIFELKNKTLEMKDDKGLDLVPMNSSSKAQLHKLLKDKKTRNNRNTNIPSTKSQTNKDFKSASSTNFFSNKNNIFKNDFKFGNLGNDMENDFESLLNNYGDNTEINNLYPLYEDNLYDNNLYKNSKVHIVNMPSLPQSHRLNNDKQYSEDALKIISALRKIRYENNNRINSNIKRVNRSNENSRDRQIMRKLKIDNNNNKFMRTFEGFNM